MSGHQLAASSRGDSFVAANGGRGAQSGSHQPTLPRLSQQQPHVNKRAQLIIASHIHSADGGGSSSGSQIASSIPVLAQLESTAPHTAKTHDISHLGDRSHTLTPTVPPSLIEAEDYVYEASFFPNGSGSSIYNERDGMWYAKVFPSDRPSSRQDAVYLDAWVTKALARHQQQLDAQGNTREDIAQIVEGLVPILSIALHEVVRQVTHHCAERGRALEKLWKTYVELFHRVLRQMRRAQVQHRSQTTEIHRQLSAVKKELTALKLQHPEHIHKVIGDLEDDFTHKQQECEDDLAASEKENLRLKTDMRTHVKELEIWYPGFLFYHDSYIKNHIPQVHRDTLVQRLRSEEEQRQMAASKSGAGDSSAPREPDSADMADRESVPKEAVPPEVAIAEDFKRLLAVLAPEKRKNIGADLSFITEAQATMQVAPKRAPTNPRASTNLRASVNKQSADAEGQDQAKVVEKLKVEVKAQEDRIRELRDSIAQLEAAELAAARAAEDKNSSVTASRIMARSSVLNSTEPQDDLAKQLAKGIADHKANLARQQAMQEFGVRPNATEPGAADEEEEEEEDEADDEAS